MNVSSISNKLVYFDRFMENVPVLSTMTAVINIIQKATLHSSPKETILSNRYYTHLKDKSYLRCIVLAIPVVGNIAVKLYDAYNNNQAEKLHKEALAISQESLTPDLTKAASLFGQAADRGHLPSMHSFALCLLNGTGIEQNHERAIEYLTRGAYSDNIDSIVQLGLCYENGLGVKADPIRAFKLFQQGAEKNHPLALYRLGNCYLEGAGTSKDETRAAELYKQASNIGHIDAINALGTCYEDGRGVDENLKRAAALYRQAAEQGHTLAKNNLGLCLLNGKGLDQNQREAVTLFKEASNEGSIFATLNLGKCYYYGYGVAQSYTEACNYFDKLKDYNDPEVNYLLGICYRDGNGVAADSSRAATYLEVAANSSNPYASHALAKLYLEGNGVERNPARAASLLNSASELGVNDATYLLATCYEKGIGVGQDKGRAATLFKQAAENDHKEASFKYALCLLKGEGVVRDRKGAFPLLKTPAKQGHIEAIFHLAQSYEQGHGTNQNADKAFDYYQKAALKGHLPSINIVGEKLLTARPIEAANWFEKATLLGCIDATLNYARCLFHGTGRTIDHKKAIEYFERVKTANAHPDALYHLGLSYYRGWGNVQNTKIAMECFEKASLSIPPHPAATYYLATYYIDGDIKQYAKAASLLKEAISGKNTLAHAQLGRLYLQGNLGNPDHRLAIDEFRKGIEAGDPQASYYLAQCYYTGLDGVQKRDEAIQLYIHASNANHPDATLALAKIYEEEKIYAEARKYYDRAVKQGSTTGNLALARFYFKGLGGKRDVEGAVKLLEDAIAVNPKDDSAITTLGILYYEEKSPCRNVKKAFELFTTAESFSDPLAMVYLGEILSTDSGIPNNYVKAAELFQTAINLTPQTSDFGANSQSLAAYHLGRCYEMGWGMAPDAKKAFEHYKAAADMEEPKAYFDLGRCYFSQTGTLQDIPEALKYLNMAKDNGHQVASKFLAVYAAQTNQLFSMLGNPPVTLKGTATQNTLETPKLLQLTAGI